VPPRREVCSECVREQKKKKKKLVDFSLVLRHIQSEEYLRFSLENLLSVNF
jgi:hypothetical protein